MKIGSTGDRRTRCVVCHGTRLSAIVETPPIPAYQGCVETDAGADISLSMEWEGCASCGSAQLANPLPLEIVYQGGHATGLGRAWDLHHKSFANFVGKHRRGDVLEVGGGGGKLARFFRTEEPEAQWYILEPNPTLGGDATPGVSLIRGFFDQNFNIPTRVETLVFCHCLEHIYDIGEIVGVMSNKLELDGRIILAWPDLENWIVRGEPGAINWEHTFFCALETLIGLFENNGFRLLAKEAFGDDHSAFLVLAKVGAPRVRLLPQIDFETARIRICEYFAKFVRKASALNEMAQERKMPIFGAPASVYIQYLFAFGLDQRLMRGLVDNSPLKQGRRLYGTSMQVMSPAALEDAASAVILNGGAHNSEMAAAFARANPETEIIFPSEIP